MQHGGSWCCVAPIGRGRFIRVFVVALVFVFVFAFVFVFLFLFLQHAGPQCYSAPIGGGQGGRGPIMRTITNTKHIKHV